MNLKFMKILLILFFFYSNIESNIKQYKTRSLADENQPAPTPAPAPQNPPSTDT